MGNHCFSKLQIRIWLRCWYHLLWVAGFKRIGNDSTLIRSKLKTSPGKNCYQQLLQHANTMSWLTEPSKKMLRKTRDKVISQWVWSTDGPHRSAALGLPTHQRELGPDPKKKRKTKNKQQQQQFSIRLSSSGKWPSWKLYLKLSYQNPNWAELQWHYGILHAVGWKAASRTHCK